MQTWSQEGQLHRQGKQWPRRQCSRGLLNTGKQGIRDRTWALLGDNQAKESEERGGFSKEGENEVRKKYGTEGGEKGSI